MPFGTHRLRPFHVVELVLIGVHLCFAAGLGGTPPGPQTILGI